MTRPNQSRVAGSTFLLYIILGITTMIVSGRASRGETVAARLASMAAHETSIRIVAILGLVTCFVALALGVSLYALTREEDQDIARFGLACRIVEAVLGATLMPLSLTLMTLADAANGSGANAAAAQTLGTFLLAARRFNPTIGALFFTVGSTAFCWLLLRGKMIPMALAWLGVIASVLLVVALPLELAGALRGSVTNLIWIPMALFEIPVGFWLIVKGAR